MRNIAVILIEKQNVFLLTIVEKGKQNNDFA